MSFGPVSLRFLRDVIVDNRQRHADEVAAIEYRLAAALIEAGYACPVGAELAELRPIVGTFAPLNGPRR